jgi:hypothetical protein
VSERRICPLREERPGGRHHDGPCPREDDLEHAEVQPWKVQDAGLLGLWLGPSRRYRLHVWEPGSSLGDGVIHDHPLDFTSTVIAGEITNTRYEKDPAGDEFVRERYAPGDEANRRTDSVRLSGTSTTFGPGESYSQAARELHSSSQVPGTVTVLRFTYVDVPLLPTRRLSLGVGHLPPSGARRDPTDHRVGAGPPRVRSAPTCRPGTHEKPASGGADHGELTTAKGGPVVLLSQPRISRAPRCCSSPT